jgi:hypothetical protein
MHEYMDNLAGRRIASTGMMKNSILPLCTMLLSAVSVLGCVGPEGDNDADTESVASTEQPAITNNAITNNAITNNAITNNAITNNAITNNAITNNAITNNALSDPNARLLFKYIVSCALPASSEVDLTIDGVDYSFPGELGLSPSWGLPGGKCDAVCQGWVSACILARVDYLGKKVKISMRGTHSALTPTAAEKAKYTSREAAYYGNIFKATDAQERFACLSPNLAGIPRVCGPTTDGCVVDVVSPCNHTCIGPSSDGFYLNCHDEEGIANTYPVAYPAGTTMYPQTVTIFLAP